MSLDFITDLEQKVGQLIKSIETLRQDNSQLKATITEKELALSILTSENNNLKDDLELAKMTSTEQQDKIRVAAEKIKEMIQKIDVV